MNNACKTIGVLMCGALFLSANTESSTNAILESRAYNGILSPNQKLYAESFGNIAQYLPTLGLGYTLVIKDFIGFRQQLIAMASVVATTYVVKYGFNGLSKINPKYARISKRPKDDKFEGFPSGHTAMAFSAAGFLQKRYGIKLGLPAVIISAVVGFSRIEAQRHTPLQVVCGALLGFLLSFFLTKPRISKPKEASSHTKNLLLLVLICVL